MSSHGQSSSPLPSSRPTTPERSDSEVPQSWKCSCGTGDGSGNYIQCDNEDCRVGWYHWECVQVIEQPVGTWLCPSCSPNAAFYIKQLVKRRAAPPLVPRFEKAVAPISSKEKEHRPKTEKAATPTSSKEKEPEPEPEYKKKEVVKKGIAIKKGIAVKKPTSEKPKPKWLGWVEMSSDGEDEYKKNVDEKFRMEDSVRGKRTRASKVAAEENETGSRMLRTRSKPGQTIKQAVETDSDEEEDIDDEDLVYQENDEEEEEETSSSEEASMYREASVSEDASVEEDPSIKDDASVPHNEEEDPSVKDNAPNSQEDSEDSMDIDEESEKEDKNSTDDQSDPPFDIEEEDSDASTVHDEKDSTAPGPARMNVESGADDADGPSQRTATPSPTASPAASSSSNLALEPTKLSGTTGEIAAVSPEPAPPASRTIEDSMDIDAEHEVQDHQGQVFVTVRPAVESNDHANL